MRPLLAILFLLLVTPAHGQGFGQSLPFLAKDVVSSDGAPAYDNFIQSGSGTRTANAYRWVATNDFTLRSVELYGDQYHPTAAYHVWAQIYYHGADKPGTYRADSTNSYHETELPTAGSPAWVKFSGFNLSITNGQTNWIVLIDENAVDWGANWYTLGTNSPSSLLYGNDLVNWTAWAVPLRYATLLHKLSSDP